MTEIITPADDLLALIGGTTELSTEVVADEVSAMVRSGDWLPRIEICGSSTTKVKEGKIAQGVFSLTRSDTDFRDIGKQIDFLSLTFRPKAMRLKNTPSGKPMSFFDRSTPDFKKIQAESESSQSGCVWGPEFLIWLPVANCFATYFCNNPTMRRAAPDLYTIMRREGSPDDKPIFDPKPATSRMHFIKTTANSWWGALFEPHTTPLPVPQIDDFGAAVLEQVTKFKNPPKSQVEVEEAPAAATTRAR